MIKLQQSRLLKKSVTPVAQLLLIFTVITILTSYFLHCKNLSAIYRKDIENLDTELDYIFNNISSISLYLSNQLEEKNLLPQEISHKLKQIQDLEQNDARKGYIEDIFLVHIDDLNQQKIINKVGETIVARYSSELYDISDISEEEVVIKDLSSKYLLYFKVPNYNANKYIFCFVLSKKLLDSSLSFHGFSLQNVQDNISQLTMSDYFLIGSKKVSIATSYMRYSDGYFKRYQLLFWGLLFLWIFVISACVWILRTLYHYMDLDRKKKISDLVQENESNIQQKKVLQLYAEEQVKLLKSYSTSFRARMLLYEEFIDNKNRLLGDTQLVYKLLVEGINKTNMSDISKNLIKILEKNTKKIELSMKNVPLSCEYSKFNIREVLTQSFDMIQHYVLDKNIKIVINDTIKSDYSIFNDPLSTKILLSNILLVASCRAKSKGIVEVKVKKFKESIIFIITDYGYEVKAEALSGEWKTESAFLFRLKWEHLNEIAEKLGYHIKEKLSSEQNQLIITMGSKSVNAHIETSEGVVEYDRNILSKVKNASNLIHIKEFIAQKS